MGKLWTFHSAGADARLWFVDLVRYNVGFREWRRNSFSLWNGQKIYERLVVFILILPLALNLSHNVVYSSFCAYLVIEVPLI